MAFSTQKEFFHIPFINEFFDFDCPGVCVNLKTYSSTVDNRCWLANEREKSRFVADFVACNKPVFVSQKNETWSNINKEEARKISIEDYGGNLLLEDSLINAADDTISRMHVLMIRNNILNNQLSDSDYKPIRVKEESAEIKRIMAKRYNAENSNALKAKIMQLTKDKKIDLHDEMELKEMLKSIDDMNKAQDLLGAENSYLKRIIEKQSIRCKLDSIYVDPELSTDVKYLQGKIDHIGKEVLVLRETEDMLIRKCAKMCRVGCYENLNGEESYMSNAFSLEQDISNIQRILQERDALRKKCKNIDALDEKVNTLEKKANEAEHLSGDLKNNLNQQSYYIHDMQQEMENMHRFYENEVEKAKGIEEILKCRCDQMMQELSSARCAAQKRDCQKMEIDELRRELLKRDIALNAYDCQYQQLMILVCELSQLHSKNQSTESCTTKVEEDIAFYTRATLDHIMNEFCKQSDCFKLINQKKSLGDPAIYSLEECTKELERLRDLIKENGDISKTVEIGNDELNTLKNILKQKDDQLELLVNENDCLCEAAEINKKKLDDLDYQVQKLDEDTRYMEQGILESIGLIQDIGDVAQENERLKGEVSFLKDSEARQLMDDLSKQLNDCREQFRLIQEINRALGETLQEVGINPNDIENKIKLLNQKESLPDIKEKGDVQEVVINPNDIENKIKLLNQKESLPDIKEKGDVQGKIGIEELGNRLNLDLVNELSIGKEDKTSHIQGKGAVIEKEIPPVVAHEVGESKSHLQDAGSLPTGEAKNGISTHGVEAVPIPIQETELKDGQKKGTDNENRNEILKGQNIITDSGNIGVTGAGKEEVVSTGHRLELTSELDTGKILGSGATQGIVAASEKEAENAKGQGGLTGAEKAAVNGKVQETVIGATQGIVTGSEKEAVKAKGEEGLTGAEKAAANGKGQETVIGAEKSAVNGKGQETVRGAEKSAIQEAGSKLIPSVGATSAQSTGPKQSEEQDGRAKPTQGSKPEKSPAQGAETSIKEEAGTLPRPVTGNSTPKGAELTVGQDTLRPVKGVISGTEKGPNSRPEITPIGTLGQVAVPLSDLVSDKVSVSKGGEKSIALEDKKGETMNSKSSRKEIGKLSEGKTPGLSVTQKRPSKLERPLRGSKTGKIYDKSKGDTSDAVTSDSMSSARPSRGSSAIVKIGKKNETGKRVSSRCTEAGQFDDFVRHTVQSLSTGEIDGCGLERELRKILDMFVDECGFCFCKCNIPKSRFYAICHKLYHHGLHTLDFKELAYMHKRIYAAAENILPGCLFNMILKDITRVSCAPTILGHFNTSPSHAETLQQCCSCKNTLCCDPNEDNLIKKVIRLESDIENAKMCLKNLKGVPSKLSIPKCRLDGCDSFIKELKNK